MEPLKWKDATVTIQGSPGFLHAVYLTPSLREAFERSFGGLDGLFGAIFYEVRALTPNPEPRHESEPRRPLRRHLL